MAVAIRQYRQLSGVASLKALAGDQGSHEDQPANSLCFKGEAKVEASSVVPPPPCYQADKRQTGQPKIQHVPRKTSQDAIAAAHHH